MLYFENFRARNAYPFVAIDVPLRNQGLVRMVGKNGSGKSTTWHLFTQACQGVSPNASKKSELMLSDRDFLMEVAFEKNGSKYVAGHAVKSTELMPDGKPYGTGVYLFRDGTDISMHKDPDTMKLIKSTMGWTIGEWYGYVYLAQATTHTLINGTRSERQEYLSALFNLQPLDELHAHFKLKAAELSEKVKALEIDKQTLAIKEQMYDSAAHIKQRETLAETSDMVQVLATKITRFQGEQKKFEDAAALRQKLQSLSKFSGSLEDLRLELSDLEGKQAQLRSNQILRNQYETDLKNLVPVAEPALPSGWKDEYAKSPDIEETREREELSRLLQLRKGLVEVPVVQIPLDLTTVLASPDINLIQVRKQFEEIKARPAPPPFTKPTPEQLTVLRDEKAEISYTILNLKTDVQRLKFNADVCDQCGTTLDCNDREAKLKEKEEALAEALDEQTVVLSKLAKREEQAQSWSDYEALGPDRSGELPELEASIALFEKKQQYKVLQSQAQARENYEKTLAETTRIPMLEERLLIWGMKQAFLKVAEQKEKLDKYLREKTRLEELLAATPVLADHSASIATLKASITQVEEFLRVYAEITALGEVKDRTEQIKALEQEKNEAHASLGSLQGSIQRLDTLQREIADLQNKISSQDTVVRDQKRYELLAKAYGKAGSLRELQLSKFSRYLEEALLSHTIKQLPDHRFHITVDDGIDIIGEYVGNAKPKKSTDIKYMSGGEQGTLSVAFLFALDDLMPPHRRTNLKILDEVEAAFDKERQQDFIQQVLPMLRERAETVIVISHSHAATAGVFDRSWVVENARIEQRGEVRQYV